jgi:hypothetical protein
VAAKKKAKPIARRARAKRICSASRATQRRKASRKRKSPPELQWGLLVTYDLPDVDVVEYCLRLDARILSVVGFPYDGSGTNFVRSVRDLSFALETQKSAFEAAVKVLKHWQRSKLPVGVSVRIFKRDIQ